MSLVKSHRQKGPCSGPQAMRFFLVVTPFPENAMLVGPKLPAVIQGAKDVVSEERNRTKRHIAH